MSRKKVWQHNNPEYMADSMDHLRNVFPIGTEVRTVVTHVAKSGMSRVIKVLAVNPEPREGESPIVDVSYHVARVVGWRFDDQHGGVYVTGCGMDMCFHVVYTLSRILYADNEDAKNMHGGNGSDVGYALSSRPL